MVTTYINAPPKRPGYVAPGPYPVATVQATYYAYTVVRHLLRTGHGVPSRYGWCGKAYTVGVANAALGTTYTKRQWRLAAQHYMRHVRHLLRA